MLMQSCRCTRHAGHAPSTREQKKLGTRHKQKPTEQSMQSCKEGRWADAMGRCFIVLRASAAAGGRARSTLAYERAPLPPAHCPVSTLRSASCCLGFSPATKPSNTPAGSAACSQGRWEQWDQYYGLGTLHRPYWLAMWADSIGTWRVPLQRLSCCAAV